MASFLSFKITVDKTNTELTKTGLHIFVNSFYCYRPLFFSFLENDAVITSKRRTTFGYFLSFNCFSKFI